MKKIIFICYSFFISAAAFAWSPGAESILNTTDSISAWKVDRLNDSGFSYMQTDLSKALEFLEPALELAEKTHNEEGIADVKCNFGNVNLYTGNNTEAFNYFTEALKIYLELSEKDMKGTFDNRIGSVYSNIALVYHHMDNYTKAIAYFAKSKAIHLKRNDQSLLLYDYINIGDTYEKMGIADSAKLYTRYALDHSLHQHDTSFIATSLLNLGNIFSRFGNSDSALIMYHAALFYAVGREEENVCEATLGIAKVLFIDQHPDSALYYAQLSLATALRTTDRMQALDASNFLCTYYGQHKNTDSLCKYQAFTIAMTDTLFKQKQAQFQDMSEAENIRQRDYEHERAESELAHTKQIKTFLIFSVLGLFCITLLFSKRISPIKGRLKPQYLKFLWGIELLLIYEFIILLSESTIGRITHEELYLTFAIQVLIGAILVRLHHYFGNMVNKKYGDGTGHH